jgi:hypothetical protein
MQECRSGEDASEHRGRDCNHGLDGVDFPQTLEKHSSENGTGAKETE